MPVKSTSFTLTKTAGAKPIRLNVYEFNRVAIGSQNVQQDGGEARIDFSGYDASSLIHALLGGGAKFEKGLFEYNTPVTAYMALKNISIKSVTFDADDKDGPSAKMLFSYYFVEMAYLRQP